LAEEIPLVQVCGQDGKDKMIFCSHDKPPKIIASVKVHTPEGAARKLSSR
jgi:hypothetical protein